MANSVSAGGGRLAGFSGWRVPLGLVARLSTREDDDTALLDMEPPHQRPDIPLRQASDLGVPKSFPETMRGEHKAQFQDAVQREVHGVIEAVHQLEVCLGL